MGCTARQLLLNELHKFTHACLLALNICAKPHMDELTGPIDQILGDLGKVWREYNEQEPFWNLLQGFFHAIDWTEPWIIGILVMHVALVLATLLWRHRSGVLLVLSLLIGAIVYNGEQLNTLGALHWQKFAKQPYFDPRGVFFSAVVSGPLLFVMFIILICYLIDAAKLLVKAKRAELRHKARQRAKQAESSEDSKKTE